MKKSMIFVMAITAGLFFGAAHGAGDSASKTNATGPQAYEAIKAATDDATFTAAWTTFTSTKQLADKEAKKAFIEAVTEQKDDKLNALVCKHVKYTAKDCGLTDKDTDKDTIKRLRPALKGESPFDWMAEHKVATGLIAGGTIAVIIGGVYAAKKYGVFGAKKDATTPVIDQNTATAYS